MANKYDDVDFYRWVRTDIDGRIVVSRPHVSLPYVKGHVSQFSTNRYGPQPTFTYRIQKLVPIYAYPPYLTWENIDDLTKY